MSIRVVRAAAAPTARTVRINGTTVTGAVLITSVGGSAIPVHQHAQSTAAAVWGVGSPPVIAHGLGRRPASVSLFSADYAQQYGQFVVQHLDTNSLRIAMDTPTAGIALIS